MVDDSHERKKAEAVTHPTVALKFKTSHSALFCERLRIIQCGWIVASLGAPPLLTIFGVVVSHALFIRCVVCERHVSLPEE